MTSVINVYCDESCHLQKDDGKAMVLGALYCNAEEVRIIADKVRAIKKKYNLPRLFETKWTKISPSKKDYYLALVDYFFHESPARFRCVLIPDKTKLDHAQYYQTHDDWYYKMYYVMLQWLIRPPKKYHVYIDIKDTKSTQRVKTLQDYLANRIYDYSRECIARVQQVRSHEVELLQLADLLIGAVAYASRHPHKTGAKAEIVERICKYLPQQSLSKSTAYSYTKFNLFVWDAGIQ
ncbi:MAG TPA: DUF3800 domain-containing protein [Rickettsiales bacterium]|nr:DUF3800 domain-containing protein [Rickettsiales bacterium]